MVISIASQKGGTGKTSTSISLASGLAHKGKKVLLIDIDSQANSSKVLLHHYQQIPKEETLYTTILERQPLRVHPTHVQNLSIVPSHILLSNTDIELTTAKDHRESRLKTELNRIKEQFDYVFIDNPPALGWLTLNSFTASDKVLVVVSPGYFELDSIGQLSKTLAEVREYFNPHLELLGYLFTMSEPTNNASASLQVLRQTYTQKVQDLRRKEDCYARDMGFTKFDYCQYLLSSQINYTLTNLADHLKKCSHDTINRYLKGEKLTPRLLFEQVQPLLEPDPEAYLIFDDTVLDKRFGAKIELTRKQWSGNEKRPIRGIGVVSCVYVNPKTEKFWVIDYRIFDPQTDGKTKLDHVEEMH